MAAPTQRDADSLEEFLAVARDIGASSATGTLWYRGARDESYELIPRLYRGDADAKKLLVAETDMLDQFRTRSRPLLDGAVGDDWEYLFVMQHYGVPTRLLDWSENALLALYFALSAAAVHQFDCDAAVWILDPAQWNAKVFESMSPPGKALYATDENLNTYEPKRSIDNMGSGIAAMYALYNNPRITAQRGVFTVFGKEKKSMEAYFESKGLPEECLIKVRLPKAALEELNAQVRLLGFRESMIYPDLVGLATEIRIGQGLT